MKSIHNIHATVAAFFATSIISDSDRSSTHDILIHFNHGICFLSSRNTFSAYLFILILLLHLSKKSLSSTGVSGNILSLSLCSVLASSLSSSILSKSFNLSCTFRLRWVYSFQSSYLFSSRAFFLSLSSSFITALASQIDILSISNVKSSSDSFVLSGNL